MWQSRNEMAEAFEQFAIECAASTAILNPVIG
jgi:hypothetical protein